MVCCSRRHGDEDLVGAEVSRGRSAALATRGLLATYRSRNGMEKCRVLGLVVAADVEKARRDVEAFIAQPDSGPEGRESVYESECRPIQSADGGRWWEGWDRMGQASESWFTMVCLHAS